MIRLKSPLEGKKAYFGEVADPFSAEGFELGGNWEYDQGSFDKILFREGAETIYLRLPFRVLSGVLDQHDAYLQFEGPLIMKHVVNDGIDHDGHSILSSTGLNQFQKPADPDGDIPNEEKWKEKGEQVIARMMQDLKLYD